MEEKKDYRFKMTVCHGMCKDKFFLVNKNDSSLCALDNHPGSNTGLPIVFNTTEEAEHYLAMVDDASEAVITKTCIHFFNNGYILYEEDPEGLHIFSFK